MKCESDETTCKITFYQKSCIKPIVFLVIRLNLTDRKELVSELSCEVRQLKEREKALSAKLNYAMSELKLNEDRLSDRTIESRRQADHFKKVLLLLLLSLVLH